MSQHATENPASTVPVCFVGNHFSPGREDVECEVGIVAVAGEEGNRLSVETTATRDFCFHSEKDTDLLVSTQKNLDQFFIFDFVSKRMQDASPQRPISKALGGVS